MDSKYTSQNRTDSVINIITNVLNKKIDANTDYQRDIVWDDQLMSNFINSVIIGIVPNNLIFNHKNGNNKVIDGKQRIHSLNKFYNNMIPVEFISKGKKELLYYSQVPKKYQLNSKFRSMNTDERNLLFNNRYISIVVYEDLSYQDQIDIFNRIQHGKKLTDGEILFSIIHNNEISVKFRKFCSEENIKNKLNKFKNVSRYEHVPIIAKIMYMIKNKTHLIPNKSKLNTYLEKLNNNDQLYMDKARDIINICFSENIFAHESITKHYVILYLTACIFIKDKYKATINFLSNNELKLIRSAYRKIGKLIAKKKIPLSDSNNNVEIIRNKLNVKINRLRKSLEYPSDEEIYERDTTNKKTKKQHISGELDDEDCDENDMIDDCDIKNICDDDIGDHPKLISDSDDETIRLPHKSKFIIKKKIKRKIKR